MPAMPMPIKPAQKTQEQSEKLLSAATTNPFAQLKITAKNFVPASVAGAQAATGS